MLRTPSYLEQVEDKSVLSAYTESDPACKDSLNHLKGICQSDHMFDPTPGLYLRF